MKQAFKGYYRPTDAEFQRLWRKALVSVDANVLLNLFRFSGPTAKALFSTLKAVESRLWLSHQAALEYHRNLPIVLSQGAKECRDVLLALAKLESSLGLDEPHAKRTPPHISSKALNDFSRIRKTLKAEIENAEASLLGQMAEHPFKEKCAHLFKGRVGQPFLDAELSDVYKDGRLRYERRRAPGFSDVKKPEPDRYGDLVMWRQLMRHCKAENADLLFVTDDQKEDWFLEVSGRTLGPLPELIEEFSAETGRQFYAYSVAQFLELANKFLEAGVSGDAISEAKTPPPPTIQQMTPVNYTASSNIPMVPVSTSLTGSFTPSGGSLFGRGLIPGEFHPGLSVVGGSIAGGVPQFKIPFAQVGTQLEDLYRPAESLFASQKLAAETFRPFDGLADLNKQVTDLYGSNILALQKQFESISKPLAAFQLAAKQIEGTMKTSAQPQQSSVGRKDEQAKGPTSAAAQENRSDDVDDGE